MQGFETLAAAWCKHLEEQLDDLVSGDDDILGWGDGGDADELPDDYDLPLRSTAKGTAFVPQPLVQLRQSGALLGEDGNLKPLSHLAMSWPHLLMTAFTQWTVQHDHVLPDAKAELYLALAGTRSTDATKAKAEWESAGGVYFTEALQAVLTRAAGQLVCTNTCPCRASVVRL